MNKKLNSIIIIIIIISLTLAYTIASTYSVIINVTEKEGITEIVNQITIKDLVTNDNGTYNTTYYNVKNELNITEEEANLIMESNKLNANLQIILESIVEYKLKNNIQAKLNNNEIYDLILEGTNNTNTLNDELKNKIITKSSIYIQDISDFLYDIDVSLIGDEI